jgi:hypothetical protein
MVSCNGDGRCRNCRATVERVDLPRIAFDRLELWELDAAGRKARRLQLAPVRAEASRLNAAHCTLARATLERDARRAGLEIVRTAR